MQVERSFIAEPGCEFYIKEKAPTGTAHWPFTGNHQSSLRLSSATAISYFGCPLLFPSLWAGAYHVHGPWTSCRGLLEKQSTERAGETAQV